MIIVNPLTLTVQFECFKDGGTKIKRQSDTYIGKKKHIGGVHQQENCHSRPLIGERNISFFPVRWGKTLNIEFLFASAMEK